MKIVSLASWHRLQGLRCARHAAHRVSRVTLPGVVMKAALLLLVLFVRPPTVVTIHGRVTDSSRGNGIAGASIVIPELNLRAQTDTAGRYNLRSTGLAANGTVTI